MLAAQYRDIFTWSVKILYHLGHYIKTASMKYAFLSLFTFLDKATFTVCLCYHVFDMCTKSLMLLLLLLHYDVHYLQVK
jgi:hypothetical protein